MITANELRIGNWLEFNNHIQPSKFIQVGRRFFSSASIDGNDDNFTVSQYYQPIPLTEEILLKCGFETNGIHIFKEFNPRMVLFFNNKNHAEMDLIQDGKSISFKCNHIKYLHELQNLFYSLCKTELIINL